ncbi:hypothetical protein D4Q52_13455 [Rhodopseudomonas palustris]|uniref:Uncharacterized protein n=1 Tax=Rhodopseudomonas palustris TaxID=1076 RepID=A0A418VDD5_RHOPL|nr:hypothetical protein D4Q52_13455 [Rhodopseudomonas palustris]
MPGRKGDQRVGFGGVAVDPPFPLDVAGFADAPPFGGDAVSGTALLTKGLALSPTNLWDRLPGRQLLPPAFDLLMNFPSRNDGSGVTEPLRRLDDSLRLATEIDAI